MMSFYGVQKLMELASLAGTSGTSSEGLLANPTFQYVGVALAIMYMLARVIMHMAMKNGNDTVMEKAISKFHKTMDDHKNIVNNDFQHLASEMLKHDLESKNCLKNLEGAINRLCSVAEKQADSTNDLVIEIRRMNNNHIK